MNEGIELFPDRGTAYAGEVDMLYAFLLAVSCVFIVGICTAIVYFSIRYRPGTKAKRAPLELRYVRIIEITWLVIPFLLTMVMFGWGASLFLKQQQAPDDAREITVVAKQWMWKLQHAEGRREINELHVPRGRPVRLKMISEDVIHSFYVPAFRVKQDVLPGRYTTLWFEPDAPGEYHLFCAEYCGTSHSEMIGRVIVQEPEDYAKWLAGGSGDTPVEAGRKLFEQFRCNTCHTEKPDARCPPLKGLLGRNVVLNGGSRIVADENYIRESILEPQAKTVAGFQPIMPTFEGQIDEQGILRIIAYINSLSEGETEHPPADDGSNGETRRDEGDDVRNESGGNPLPESRAESEPATADANPTTDSESRTPSSDANSQPVEQPR